jgi:hypothetical protein
VTDPIELWSDGAWRCVLQHRNGVFELLLFEEGRLVRVEKCASEHHARNRSIALWGASPEERAQ